MLTFLAGSLCGSIAMALWVARPKPRYQDVCLEWAEMCFRPSVVNDVRERLRRFLEEALELVQSLGLPRETAHRLVDYVYDRPVGNPDQEVGGVGVTLGVLCSVVSIDMEECFDVELDRILQPEVMEKVRAKQAAKIAAGVGMES